MLKESVNNTVKHDNNMAELSLQESRTINVEMLDKRRKQFVENRMNVLLPKFHHNKL